MEPVHRRVEPVEPVEFERNEECIFFKLYRFHRFHTPVHRFHASAPCGSIGSTRPCTNGRGMPRHIGFAPCLGQSREVPEETPVAVFSGMPFCMVNNESHSMCAFRPGCLRARLARPCRAVSASTPSLFLSQITPGWHTLTMAAHLFQPLLYGLVRHVCHEDRRSDSDLARQLR